MSMHFPTHIDIGVYIGTIGLFFVFFLLFARFFPVLALNEVKSILKSSGESYKNGPDTHHDGPKPTPIEATPIKDVVENKVEKEVVQESKNTEADEKKSSEDDDSSDSEVNNNVNS